MINHISQIAVCAAMIAGDPHAVSSDAFEGCIAILNLGEDDAGRAWDEYRAYWEDIARIAGARDGLREWFYHLSPYDYQLRDDALERWLEQRFFAADQAWKEEYRIAGNELVKALSSIAPERENELNLVSREIVRARILAQMPSVLAPRGINFDVEKALIELNDSPASNEQTSPLLAAYRESLDFLLRELDRLIPEFQERMRKKHDRIRAAIAAGEDIESYVIESVDVSAEVYGIAWSVRELNRKTTNSLAAILPPETASVLREMCDRSLEEPVFDASGVEQLISAAQKHLAEGVGDEDRRKKAKELLNDYRNQRAAAIARVRSAYDEFMNPATRRERERTRLMRSWTKQDVPSNTNDAETIALDEWSKTAARFETELRSLLDFLEGDVN